MIGNLDGEQNYSKVVSVLITLQNVIHTPTFVDVIMILLRYIGGMSRQKVSDKVLCPKITLAVSSIEFCQ